MTNVLRILKLLIVKISCNVFFKFQVWCRMCHGSLLPATILGSSRLFAAQVTRKASPPSSGEQEKVISRRCSGRSGINAAIHLQVSLSEHHGTYWLNKYLIGLCCKTVILCLYIGKALLNILDFTMLNRKGKVDGQQLCLDLQNYGSLGISEYIIRQTQYISNQPNHLFAYDKKWANW